jgi:hypothetical protein
MRRHKLHWMPRPAKANRIGNGWCPPATAARAFLFPWLVAANDSYFAPDLSRRMADAFRAGGDEVDFRVAAAYGSEGHWVAETEGGLKAAGPELDRALKAQVVIASQRVGAKRRPMTGSAKRLRNPAAKTGLLRRKRSSQ